MIFNSIKAETRGLSSSSPDIRYVCIKNLKIWKCKSLTRKTGKYYTPPKKKNKQKNKKQTVYRRKQPQNVKSQTSFFKFTAVISKRRFGTCINPLEVNISIVNKRSFGKSVIGTCYRRNNLTELRPETVERFSKLMRTE